ncbi:hypothetical protein PWY87_08360 [Kribbella solani]|uniref:hypothetical protein n=1 Tax=Kribbella solani TaxID=236067 RepID=UPI0029BD669B|nr:hypothetical protein [Kribbella solani]MDX3001674.1 hypothetical protein [Kribbella solani]
MSAEPAREPAGRTTEPGLANHSSHLDAPLPVSHLPVRLTRRLEVGAAAAGTSGRLLDAGLSLLIFPEGTRSRDGLNPGKIVS